MTFNHKITILLAFLLWGCPVQSAEKDMEMDITETIGQKACRLHQEMHKGFALLGNLPLNEERIPESHVIPTKKGELEIYEKIQNAGAELNQLFPHLPPSAKSHILTDTANYFYYHQYRDGYTTRFEDLYSQYKSTAQTEHIRKEEHYYKSLSLSKIFSNELSTFKRYAHLDPSTVGGLLIKEQMNAAKYARGNEKKLYTYSDLITTASIIPTENKNGFTHYPFKKSRTVFIEGIYQSVNKKIQQPGSIEALTFRNTYHFIRNNMFATDPTHPGQFAENPYLKVANCFLEECLVTTLIEPEICLEFDQYLQSLCN